MKEQKPRIAYFPIGRTHFDVDLAEKLSSDLFTRLKGKFFEILGKGRVLWNVEEVENSLSDIQGIDIDLILIFQATFTDSSLITEIAEKINAPIVIWSIPEKWIGRRLRLNSFTGLNLAAHALHKRAKDFFYIYSDMDDQKSFSYLTSIVCAAYAVNKLRTMKIGLLGNPPDAFETSEFNSEQIHTKFGLDLRKYEIEDFFKKVKSIPPNRTMSAKRELGKKITNLEELDKQAVDKTVATLQAFLDLQIEDQLNGLAVRCWPEFFTNLGCAACGALSLATEHGLPCSCEADIVGLIGQLILQIISDKQSIGVDIVGFDLDKDKTAVWHCGCAPFSMANPKYPLEGANHSNRGIPLVMQFPFKPGKITITRFTQAEEQMKLIISRAEMLNQPRPFTGTCGLLRFGNPASQILDEIMSIGMEHHISFVYGDYYTELEVIARLLDLPIISL